MDRVDQGARRSQVEPATKWAAAGFLLALAASLVMLLAPLGTQVEASTTPAPGSSDQVVPSETKVSHPSLLAHEGWTGAVPLSVPVLLGGAGLLAAHHRFRPLLVAVAVVLGAFVALGALSVGIYYLPAEVAMIVAIGKERR